MSGKLGNATAMAMAITMAKDKAPATASPTHQKSKEINQCLWLGAVVAGGVRSFGSVIKIECERLAL